MREHEPPLGDDPPDATRGREISTREFVRHIAITEQAMVRTFNSAERVAIVCAGCQVSERRARRLIKAVNMMWHYRAKAFGTPDKAKTRLLPLVQGIYERALQQGKLTTALAAVKLQGELCGLGAKQEVAVIPVDVDRRRAEMAPGAEEVAQRVLDRLLTAGAHGGNGRPMLTSGDGHGGNGHGPS